MLASAYLCCSADPTKASGSSAFLAVSDTEGLDGITPPEVLEASKKMFMVQHVGLQDNRARMPRSPLSFKARKCLTVSNSTDDMDGVSLEWVQCMDSAVHSGKVIKPIYDAQLFVMNLDGTIKAKKNDLCIRFVPCGQDEVMYDLSSCSEKDSVSTFMVHKAIANSIERLKPMGFPVQAVAHDQCSLCGPYMLTRRCLGERLPSGVCQMHWNADPGWTKLGSQYIGDFANQGMGNVRNPEQAVMEVVGKLRTGDLLEERSDGVGRTGFGSGDKGVCGSRVTSSVNSESMFYLLHQK